MSMTAIDDTRATLLCSPETAERIRRHFEQDFVVVADDSIPHGDWYIAERRLKPRPPKPWKRGRGIPAPSALRATRRRW